MSDPIASHIASNVKGYELLRKRVGDVPSKLLRCQPIPIGARMDEPLNEVTPQGLS